MNFSIERSLEILSRTSGTLEVLLSGLNVVWTSNNEGPDTWSPYDIVGHLVHGEKTDWMERMDIILNRNDKHFRPFGRFAQFTESKGKSMQDLLSEFRKLRSGNLKKLKSLNLIEDKLCLTGIHPKFGEITLKQLLSAWTIHDLSHIAQICRVMAKQYKEASGPWIEYLPILNK